MTKFAIIGTGALGGFYGGLLAKAGRDVHFLARSDAEYINAHGLRVDSKQGDFHLPKVNVYSNVHDMPKCDCVVLALKSTQNPSFARCARPRAIADTGSNPNLCSG